ncbi:PLP-dependent aminotransferase family protein [Plantactinospora sp. GCM10030261]|uniref:aminotransferase-like domain-containing protein n=1 Tax=Plantactinospora sp. GCM10030261 TaxID=3273420 RepID=UPI00361496E0
MQLQDALGDWSTGSGPLYGRLADAIRSAIHRGDLPPGGALPAERALARRLAIGRGTVVAAYDVLRAEHLLDSRQGSGTWIRGAPRRPAAEEPPGVLRMAALRDATLLIDLATAALPATDRLREVLAGLPDEETDGILDTPGYLPGGLPALRQSLADHLTRRDLPTAPDQILVTTGEQQALALLCEEVLHRGDTAVVEDPTNPGVLDILRGLPVEIVGVRAVTEDPIDLTRALERQPVRLVHLMPVLGPLGRVLDVATGARLARRLAGAGALVIEDTGQVGLAFRPAPPPLAAVVDAPNLVVIGSLSKLHWGGLRLGWIRGSAPLIARLTRAKARADLGTPVLDQIVATRLLAVEGDVRAARLVALRESLAHATDILPRVLPGFSWRPPDGGLGLWLRLPAGTATAFAEVATRFGVAVVPGAAFSAHGTTDDHLRLVYARPPEVFDEGVRRLAEAWSHYRRSAEECRTGPAVAI